MGVEAEEGERMVAFVACRGTRDKIKVDYDYVGLHMTAACFPLCQTAAPSPVISGCLGYGSCVEVCPWRHTYFLMVWRRWTGEACKACGKCLSPYVPRIWFRWFPIRQNMRRPAAPAIKAPLRWRTAGPAVSAAVSVEKNCPSGAIKVENFQRHHWPEQMYRLRHLCGEVPEEGDCPLQRGTDAGIIVKTPDGGLIEQEEE